MITMTLQCPIVEVNTWCVTGMHPTASKHIAVEPAKGAVGNIRHRTLILKSAEKRF